MCADGEKRVSIHRVIPGNYAPSSRTGIRTTVFGEKRRYFPKKSVLSWAHMM
jgi:sulfonate dioxygenase